MTRREPRIATGTLCTVALLVMVRRELCGSTALRQQLQREAAAATTAARSAAVTFSALRHVATGTQRVQTPCLHAC
jgi:hypothetical protein